MVGSEQYDLLQFHFHTPSEHKVNAKGAPMEVHFGHLRSGALPCDPQALLVIGAMIKQDDDTHRELNKIFGVANLPHDSTAGPVSVPNFNLNRVLPKLGDTWRYAGSLTAPSTFTNCTVQGGIDRGAAQRRHLPRERAVGRVAQEDRNVQAPDPRLQASLRGRQFAPPQPLNSRVVTRVRD